jgi:hypothetical protein
MKTIALLAVLFAGSAFAGNYDFAAADAALRDPKNIGSNYRPQRPEMPDPVLEARKAAANRTLYVPRPDAPDAPVATSRRSNVDLTIVNLPGGRTATALTYH